MKRLLLILALLVSACGSDYSYITNHGLAVTVGEMNSPSPAQVERWTDYTIVFWRFHFPHWLVCMNNTLQSTTAVFVDDKELEYDGAVAAGFAFKDDLEIQIAWNTFWGMNNSKNVFIHELSHVFVGECGGVWDANGSHSIFSGRGLYWYIALLPQAK